MNVRPLQESDFADCVTMGARMHEESEYGCLEFDPLRCFEFAQRAVEDDDIGWFVAVEDGRVIGMIGGYVEAPIFSEDKIAQDFIVYVVPEKRNGTTFRRLFVMFYRWTISRGANVLFVRPVTKFNLELFYSRHGFEYVGRIYRRFIR
jgi:GNAT superfamily N-acetyltransferase